MNITAEKTSKDNSNAAQEDAGNMVANFESAGKQPKLAHSHDQIVS